jgi:hypothetical protein
MTAMEPLCSLIGIDFKIFSKEEKKLLEADLFTRVCAELKEIYRHQYKYYFYLMKLSKDREDEMLEEKFIQNILLDIVSSKEYDPQGIALYTDMHVDVILELISGLNTQPSAICFRKIIGLDRIVRPLVYKAIGEKIIGEFDHT